jgi:GrpB-like predicted nucleotidyltransferase (UPF0157 family)
VRENRELQRHLAFRDYLRSHPDAAREYGALKHRAAVEAGGDRNVYGEAKSAFIEGALASMDSQR